MVRFLLAVACAAFFCVPAEAQLFRRWVPQTNYRTYTPSGMVCENGVCRPVQSATVVQSTVAPVASKPIPKAATAPAQDFKSQLLEATTQAEAEGLITEAEATKLRLAAQSPSAVKAFESAVSVKVKSHGFGAPKIDWASWLNKIKVALPVILELIDLFTDMPQPAPSV